MDEFLAGLGGQEEQDAYLNSLADYKAKAQETELSTYTLILHVWYERERITVLLYYKCINVKIV